MSAKDTEFAVVSGRRVSECVCERLGEGVADVHYAHATHSNMIDWLPVLLQEYGARYGARGDASMS